MTTYSAPKLSILTPTIPGRESQLKWLQSEIQRQDKTGQVEHLVFCDNRMRSIGAKRQALVDVARGEYVAFVDDDDKIRDGYVESLIAAMSGRPDVITFEQHAVYNGLESKVVFKLGQGDGDFNPGGITHRDAWHVCAWKRERVYHCLFGETNYSEDIIWCQQARRHARNSFHIPLILHEYHHDQSKTAAPEPGRREKGRPHCLSQALQKKQR